VNAFRSASVRRGADDNMTGRRATYEGLGTANGRRVQGVEHAYLRTIIDDLAAKKCER